MSGRFCYKKNSFLVTEGFMKKQTTYHKRKELTIILPEEYSYCLKSVAKSLKFVSIHFKMIHVFHRGLEQHRK